MPEHSGAEHFDVVIVGAGLSGIGAAYHLKTRLPGKTYAIWLNSQKFRNFKDTAGRPAVPYLLVFRTRAEAG